MRNSGASRKSGSLLITFLALIAFAAVPLVSWGSTTSTSVVIVNNSGGEIRNVFLSHVNVDDWSNDLLGDATIAPGQSYTLNNIACDQQQVKVIAEDKDGCFFSTTVSCGDSSTWTITSDTPRDCGY